MKLCSGLASISRILGKCAASCFWASFTYLTGFTRLGARVRFRVKVRVRVRVRFRFRFRVRVRVRIVYVSHMG